MNRDRQRRSGFTIIELLLAMSFIAVLLIAIGVTTIEISRIYTKGITLKEVNQAGRAVTEDLQRSINAIVPINVSASGPDQRYKKLGDDGGRLCLGDYSYVWNYGKNLRDNPGNPPVNTYSDGSPVYFAKVNDHGAVLCDNSHLNDKIQHNDAIELLTVGDHNLALHDFSIAKTTEDSLTGQAIYAIRLVIGTNDEVQLRSGDASCKAPAEASEQGYDDYCAVNIFELVARAGNKGGD